MIFHFLSFNLEFIHGAQHNLNFLQIHKSYHNTSPFICIGILIHAEWQRYPCLCFCLLDILTMSLCGEYRGVFHLITVFCEIWAALFKYPALFIYQSVRISSCFSTHTFIVPDWNQSGIQRSSGRYCDSEQHANCKGGSDAFDQMGSTGPVCT
jgi:hypothetical protein